MRTTCRSQLLGVRSALILPVEPASALALNSESFADRSVKLPSAPAKNMHRFFAAKCKTEQNISTKQHLNFQAPFKSASSPDFSLFWQISVAIHRVVTPAVSPAQRMAPGDSPLGAPAVRQWASWRQWWQGAHC